MNEGVNGGINRGMNGVIDGGMNGVIDGGIVVYSLMARILVQE